MKYAVVTALVLSFLVGTPVFAVGTCYIEPATGITSYSCSPDLDTGPFSSGQTFTLNVAGDYSTQTLFFGQCYNGNGYPYVDLILTGESDVAYVEIDRIANLDTTVNNGPFNYTLSGTLPAYDYTRVTIDVVSPGDGKDESTCGPDTVLTADPSTPPFTVRGSLVTLPAVGAYFASIGTWSGATFTQWLIMAGIIIGIIVGAMGIVLLIRLLLGISKKTLRTKYRR